MEIFYTTKEEGEWVGPFNISGTDGWSDLPDIASGRDCLSRVVWADSSLGNDACIYGNCYGYGHLHAHVYFRSLRC